MRIAGIVAEYNPFHNGHAFHIEKTRSKNGGDATHVVAVMSGSFVQRGEPAVMPKFERARAALAGGADLVLELPVPWCLSSAEGFAFGAISLLETLGCVDILSFGSEAGDLKALEKTVAVMESDRYGSLLRCFLGMGIAFPEAQQKAVAEIGGNTLASVLSAPNNTLGIEYIKALHRLNSSILPYTVERHGSPHNSMAPLGDTASATYLRSLLYSNRLINAFPYMPSSCAAVLSDAAQKGRLPADTALIERAVLSKLRLMTIEELSTVPGISEGLENRVYNAVRKAGSLSELENAVKTKRYPLTRVRRLIWSAYLDIPAGYAAKQPPYLRVLAANERGKEILSAAKPAVPLLYRAAQVPKLSEECQALWALENRATDLYGMAFEHPLACGEDCTTGLIREP